MVRRGRGMMRIFVLPIPAVSLLKLAYAITRKKGEKMGGWKEEVWESRT